MFQKPALSSLKGLMVTNSVQLYPKESCSCPSLVASQNADSQFAESQIAESN
jgi:hypothetical protein